MGRICGNDVSEVFFENLIFHLILYNGRSRVYQSIQCKGDILSSKNTWDFIIWCGQI